jgi:hypothetical protein
MFLYYQVQVSVNIPSVTVPFILVNSEISLKFTIRNTVIGYALSEVVHFEPLLDHISAEIQDLNRY